MQSGVRPRVLNRRNITSMRGSFGRGRSNRGTLSDDMQKLGNPVRGLRRRHAPRVLHVVASRQPLCCPRTLRHPHRKSAILQPAIFTKLAPRRYFDMGSTRTARTLARIGSLSPFLLLASRLLETVPSTRTRINWPAWHVVTAISVPRKPKREYPGYTSASVAGGYQNRPRACGRPINSRT